MNIKEENIEQLINCGAFGYDAERIACIMNFDVKEVVSEMKNENSELSKLLKKGKIMADYLLDMKLFEMAKSGDLKAMENLEIRKKLRK